MKGTDAHITRETCEETCEAPSKVFLRPARAGDEPALALLAGQLGYESTPETLTRRLGLLVDRADTFVFVALTGEHAQEDLREDLQEDLREDLRENGRVDASGATCIGFVHAREDLTLHKDPCVEVAALVVREEARGLGVGRALLEAAEDWARARGHTEVWLLSNVLRAAAHAFYKRGGYAQPKTGHLFCKSLTPVNHAATRRTSP